MTYYAQLARHLEPDAGPDHDDTAACGCTECVDIALWDEAEERGDWGRDGV